MIDFGESPSLQLRVLGFCSLIDGDIGVSVFPQREEVFVGGECAYSRSIGIRSLRGSRLQRIRPSHSQMR